MAQILVADDDITTQLILQHALEEQGHEVYTAEDGEIALSLAQKHHPNLVICDWMMPKVDGLEVCKTIKADPHLASAFFILLTAKEQSTDRIKGLDSGADDFISKPIEIEEILARVRSGLRIHNLNQQILQTNQQLIHALSNLKQAQVQLVQHEKMLTLVQFVAGIAHEINNPVTFIRGNIDYVLEYTQNLLEVVHLYQHIYPQSQPEIQAKLQELEVEYIIQDLPQVLKSMQQGTERISNIIQSLKNFSRLDESEKKLADIHQGIDNTLLMLQSRINQNPDHPIQVIKLYGEISPIICYPSHLNQVFISLLNNAIDAIAEHQKKSPLLEPKIWIKTETCISSNPHQSLNPSVRIMIQDNGIGIPKEIGRKIFEPFFTTKPVGSGTGLGLSIAYQIVVEKHGGTFRFHSELGKGTEFIIEIPALEC
ncbi:Response regulator receiver domain protein [Planktothrix serta PCC 8927]|uniref:histidine kinase n=1 Tax=Planktothrix serta PCC 8927 TaxID=671068 RepID=A0A7Z9DXP2_9CYAN|nr:response regulator [Planktothrix serta]VXD14894.1 Response regulator receiver domain protein [Planktothrix serta PCC 8927]